MQKYAIVAALAAFMVPALEAQGLDTFRKHWKLSGEFTLDVAKAMLAMCAALDSRVLLACSSSSAHATGEFDLIRKDLQKLAMLAVPHGIRIAYEALSWGRHVNQVPLCLN